MNQTEFQNTYHEVLAENGWELAKKDVKELLTLIPEAIYRQLKKKPPAGKNQVAVLPGLGRFTLRKLPRRKVRVPFVDPPQTKWAPATKKVRATIAKPLRDRVMTIK
jgi:nucleoid DNA-binding protein